MAGRRIYHPRLLAPSKSFAAFVAMLDWLGGQLGA
jgi:hypothetical protein